MLVEPAVPENIGAAARALKTLGFSDFRLVNPKGHHKNAARWLAHGSLDILKNARIFHDFQEATDDLDFLIGTTAKRRSVKQDYYSPEESRQIIEQKKGIIKKVGIVFGREESGLKNEELLKCDIASTIPLSQPYPSLNLGQSVMLYAYVFSKLKTTTLSAINLSATDDRLYHELKENSKEIFKRLKIDINSNLYHRMMERISMTNEDDARLFLSFAKKFGQEFEKRQN